MRSKNRYLLGVTLADGSIHEFKVPKMPAHWCSWVMQQMPYGTVYTGCSFYREKLETADSRVYSKTSKLIAA